MQRDVVEAAQGGDLEAFEALATAAGDRLYAIATLILRDRQRAEDAVQDALLHAWRELPRLRDLDRFDAWLHRLIVNACADEGRHQRRWSAEVRMIRSEPTTDDDVQIAGGSRPARARLQAPEARATNGRRPPLLCRAARPGDCRNARHPGRDGEVPAPLRDGDPPRRARRGRTGADRGQRTTA